MSPTEAMDLTESLLELDGHLARSINEGPIWQVADYLAADQVEALSGKPHPARPKRSAKRANNDPQRLAARERALDRKKDRERRIASGEIK